MTQDTNINLFFQKVLDAFPAYVFVVDADVQVFAANTAARRQLKLKTEDFTGKGGGDVLGCMNAKRSEGGCGCSDACKDCEIRNAVANAVSGGQTIRKKTRAQLNTENGIEPVYLMISATPFAFADNTLVLVVLEDYSEVVALRSLLPICSKCKKIRSSNSYWEELEQYFSTHHALEFSHGICDQCLGEATKEGE